MAPRFYWVRGPLSSLHSSLDNFYIVSGFALCNTDTVSTAGSLVDRERIGMQVVVAVIAPAVEVRVRLLHAAGCESLDLFRAGAEGGVVVVVCRIVRFVVVRIGGDVRRDARVDDRAAEQLFRLRSEQRPLFFRECVLEQLVKALPAPLMSRHLISPELTALMDYDRENGTQYFETFREYLLQERDIPRTSKALIIHRTTLLYRLQKIRSLIRVNPDDPWQRLYLLFSLWLLEGENRKRSI